MTLKLPYARYLHKEPQQVIEKHSFIIFTFTEFLGRTSPKVKEVVEQKLTEHLAHKSVGVFLIEFPLKVP